MRTPPPSLFAALRLLFAQLDDYTVELPDERLDAIRDSIIDTARRLVEAEDA